MSSANLEDRLERADRAFFGITALANAVMGFWRGYAAATGQPQPPAYDLIPPALFGAYLTVREGQDTPYRNAREALIVFSMGSLPAVAGEMMGFFLGGFAGLMERMMKG